MAEVKLFVGGKELGTVESIDVKTHNSVSVDVPPHKVSFAKAAKATADIIGIDPIALASFLGISAVVECPDCHVMCKQVPDSLKGVSAEYECPKCRSKGRVYWHVT